MELLFVSQVTPFLTYMQAPSARSLPHSMQRLDESRPCSAHPAQANII